MLGLVSIFDTLPQAGGTSQVGDQFDLQIVLISQTLKHGYEVFSSFAFLVVQKYS